MSEFLHLHVCLRGRRVPVATAPGGNCFPTAVRRRGRSGSGLDAAEHLVDETFGGATVERLAGHASDTVRGVREWWLGRLNPPPPDEAVLAILADHA